MSNVLTSFKHRKLPISVKIPVTLLQIICMTALSPNSSSWTTSLLTCYLCGCKKLLIISDDLKKQITDALLNMHNKPKWNPRLQGFNISEFIPIDMNLYDIVGELNDAVHGMSLSSTYY